MAARNRGSITDCITQEEIPFQYEPAFDMKESTNYGTQKVIGRRLTNKVWVGTGAGDMSIEFTLVGAAHTRLMPTPSEIGEDRYRKTIKANVENPQVWVPDEVDELGRVTKRGHYAPNPNYNPQYQVLPHVLDDNGNQVLVPNPDYVNPTPSVQDSAADLRIQKTRQNKKVMSLLASFRQFLEPQEDTGAPHPIYVNMGGTYKGRKFVVLSIDWKPTVTNYATLDPTEIVCKLSLTEIPAVIVKPEPIASSATLTGKGTKPSKAKLSSLMKAHKTPVKSKSRRS